MRISDDQRRVIRERAGGCCEYCRIAESGQLSTFHVDHIIAIKHGGTDTTDNLCLACYKCNGYKSSNVAALDPDTGDATKRYNPRTQRWDDHFQIRSDGRLRGLTPEGRATVLVLRINAEERVRLRRLAILNDDYPCKKS